MDERDNDDDDEYFSLTAPETPPQPPRGAAACSLVHAQGSFFNTAWPDWTCEQQQQPPAPVFSDAPDLELPARKSSRVTSSSGSTSFLATDIRKLVKAEIPFKLMVRVDDEDYVFCRRDMPEMDERTCTRIELDSRILNSAGAPRPRSLGRFIDIIEQTCGPTHRT